MRRKVEQADITDKIGELVKAMVNIERLSFPAASGHCQARRR